MITDRQLHGDFEECTDGADESDHLNPCGKLPTPVIIVSPCNGENGENGQPTASTKCIDNGHGSMVSRNRPPPDGGLYAWLICLAAFWTNGAIFGVINSEGVLHVRLLEMYGDDKSGGATSFTISLVGSLSIGTTFLLSPIAAILTDTFGIRQTAFVGSVLVVIGMFFSSFVTSLGWLYVTYGLMLGVGASLAYTPSLVILGHYFKRRLGFVNGVATAGSSVFTMVLPFIMKAMLDKVQLSGTFLLLSAMVLLLLPCALLFKPLHRPVDEDNVATSNSVCQKFVNTSIWSNRKYMVWAMAFPVSLFGYFVPYVHLIKHVNVILPGYSGEALITCIAAASMFGRIAFGHAADFRGVSRIQLQQLSFFSLGVLTMLLSVADQYWTLVVICIGLGIFDGCFISLLGPIAFEIVGQKGASQAIGFLLGICSVPLTLGPPIAGWLYDHTGKSYEIAFLVAGIPPIIGSVLMFAINRVNQPAFDASRAVVINDDNHGSPPLLDEKSKLTHSVTNDTKISEDSPDDNSVWKLRDDIESNGHPQQIETDKKNGINISSGDDCEVPSDGPMISPAATQSRKADQVTLNNQKNDIITEREYSF